MTLPRNANQPALVSTETKVLAATNALDGRVTVTEATATNHESRIAVLEVGATPLPHGSTHAIGSTDPIPMTLATNSSNGYLRQLSGNATDVLLGDGTWGPVPGGGGGGSGLAQPAVMARLAFGGF